jgi:SAM-dependent methyltransferase
VSSVLDLYELWSREEYSALGDRLRESLGPRGVDWLFELFASLGPEPGQVVVDVGARDAGHTIRLARDHGLRGIALDPVPLHVERARAAIAEAGVDVEAVEGAAEEMPVADASVDWIWCRDVLVHVEVERGLRECARILKPGGRMVAFVTLAGASLEPREGAFLAETLALECLDPDRLEAAAAAAGLAPERKVELGAEWRERRIEEGEWDANADLLGLSRLNRRREELARLFGRTAVDTYVAGRLWGIYQLLGKLAPTVYVWERRA